MTTKTKRPRAPKQQRIPGTHDPIPAELQEKVEEYVKQLRARMKSQKAEDTLRAEVLELMKKHDVVSVPLEDEPDKYLVLDRGHESVKIKKRKEPLADNGVSNGAAD